ncbi:MAG: DUF1592 domain-containing protein [Planctomycetales bacterium]|nr:DUF1592 domain-containing protein [Planctomycetales bacterium]
MARKLTFLFVVLFVLTTVETAITDDSMPSSARLDSQFAGNVRPLFIQYCADCHSGSDAEAEIDIAAFKTASDARANTQAWQTIRTILNTQQMPPKDSPQPDDDELAAMTGWVRDFLKAEAVAHAGDPGPVVLRRLNNAEYTYTVRDLTGIPTLDPAKEFPIDGAAGEGFTNTGQALSMSPSLVTKYLDAAKQIADHAVLLPDTIAFSPNTTQRDWTDEHLQKIRAFYQQFTESSDGRMVELLGLRFPTDQGGLLPLEDYVRATVVNRSQITSGKTTIAEVASESRLNKKYLQILWAVFTTDAGNSPILDQIRRGWRDCTVESIPRLVAFIRKTQDQLWKFNPIGHLERPNGPKLWMEPVTPMAAAHEFRIPIPKLKNDDPITLHLTATPFGNVNGSREIVLWQNARLESEGRPTVLLRDVTNLSERLQQLRRELKNDVAEYLNAIAKIQVASDGDSKSHDFEQLAKQHDVDSTLLRTWMSYLLVTNEPVSISDHFTEKMTNVGGYAAITGWGTSQTPSISLSTLDSGVNIPGRVEPGDVVVHPSPTLFVAVGWQSPIDGFVQVAATIKDAHAGCGNGQEWSVQHRSARQTAIVARGEFEAGGSGELSATKIAVRKGELISLVIGPRDGQHACDLTRITLSISEVGGQNRNWDLASDNRDNILASNPHPDRLGNNDVWHFYRGPVEEALTTPAGPGIIPEGSLLAKWQAETNPKLKSNLAMRIADLLSDRFEPQPNSPDAILCEQLRRLVDHIDRKPLLAQLEPDPRFGASPLGDRSDQQVAPEDFAVASGQETTITIPAELAQDATIVVTGTIAKWSPGKTPVQLRASLNPANDSNETDASLPVVSLEGSDARSQLESSYAEFHRVFPVALCYERIVPIDEVVTLTLFYRQDDALKQLMLNEQQSAKIDRLWDELKYIADEPLAYAVAFEQIREFSTQDRPDLVVEWDKVKNSVVARAAAYREYKLTTESAHIDAVVQLAENAFRRPLTADDVQRIRGTYHALRENGIVHDEAIRLTIARVLTSPAFLYRLEKASDRSEPIDVSPFELATRLSYFLWSSQPDESLRNAAANESLTADGELLSQTERMLADEKCRRMAIHFACQWLHIRDFDQNDEKNETLYPEFATLRSDMYEETVRFFHDMIRNNGSVLDIFDADHTFVNASLAKHYGFPNSTVEGWQKVDGVRELGRGGVLGMATVLASQSGASRTSPILRGNWVSETLLGERLPKPPPNVPQLPEAVPTGLTARQLIEKHSSAPECAKCHLRIDPYGFALEQYDAIGRLRTNQADTKTKLLDGKEIEGIDGLRSYLTNDRRDAVLHQFCRKLLGYALGREIILSDEPLIDNMKKQFAQNDYCFHTAIKMIVTSPQFRRIR